MAQTGISTEESSEPTSSLKPSEGLAKDGTDSQVYPDPELPVPTPSESGPSGAKSAERSSERKQPARASKRDIVFVRRNQRMCVSVLNLDPPVVQRLFREQRLGRRRARCTWFETARSSPGTQTESRERTSCARSAKVCQSCPEGRAREGGANGCASTHRACQLGPACTCISGELTDGCG